MIKALPMRRGEKLADFSLALLHGLYKDNFAVLAQPGIAKPQTECRRLRAALIKNDFAWASKNRDSILAMA